MITFTRTELVYDPATDTTLPVTTTIDGEVLLKKGDPVRYEMLNLVTKTPVTMLFTPRVYPLKAFTDEFVKPGDKVVLNGREFTTEFVTPFAPDGFVIFADIIASI